MYRASPPPFRHSPGLMIASPRHPERQRGRPARSGASDRTLGKDRMRELNNGLRYSLKVRARRCAGIISLSSNRCSPVSATDWSASGSGVSDRDPSDSDSMVARKACRSPPLADRPGLHMQLCGVDVLVGGSPAQENGEQFSNGVWTDNMRRPPSRPTGRASAAASRPAKGRWALPTIGARRYLAAILALPLDHVRSGQLPSHSRRSTVTKA
jgi:hypothetical protein